MSDKLYWIYHFILILITVKYKKCNSISFNNVCNCTFLLTSSIKWSNIRFTLSFIHSYILYKWLFSLLSCLRYSGTCLIRHTKGPGNYVGLYRMSENSGFHKYAGISEKKLQISMLYYFRCFLNYTTM